jgi:predicted ATPase
VVGRTEVTYDFERWQLRIDARQLEVDGRPAMVGGRALKVLRILADSADQPVAKDRLLQEVWGNVVVEEGNLPVHVSALRKLLGADAIMTVPGRGYQLVTRAPCPPSAPVPPPADAPPGTGTIPLSLIPLIGREQELEELMRMLRASPVVTLIGAGGVGKTRLAAAAVHALQGMYPQGAWWVDLADVQRAPAVVERVAGVLGVTLRDDEDRAHAIGRALRGDARLLVLDNCEHLVDAVAALVEALRQHQSRVTLLVTSQAPLRVPHEVQLRLGPLRLPHPGMAMGEALQADALALLVARARAIDSRFELQPAGLGAAIEICRALDGNALAIEMAASRLPWMGVHGVAARLAERFRMLSLDWRAGAVRHRSLHTMLEWSHGLLAPNEQLVFRRLAVFAGTFALEQVPGVVCDEAVDEWEAIDALGVLVERSLVQLADDAPLAGQLRYRLLDTPRMFARERIEAAGELRPTLLRHAGAFSRRCAALNQRFWDEGEESWLAQVRPDRPNLHLALDTAACHGDPAQAAELCEALTNAERIAPGGREAWSWNDRIEPLAREAPASLRARLLLAIGTALRNVQPAQSSETLARGLKALPPDGDPRIRYMLAAGRATNLARSGRTEEAARTVALAETIVAGHWPPKLRALVVLASAFLALMQGDPARARNEFRRARDLAVAANAQSLLTIVSLNLVEVDLQLGDAHDAVLVGEQLVCALRERGSLLHLALALCNSCAAKVQTGDDAGARAAGVEALSLLREEGLNIWLFDHFALLLHRHGRHEDAACLLGHADAARMKSGKARTPLESKVRDEVHSGVRAALGEQCWARWQSKGARLDAGQAEALASQAIAAAF